MGISRTSESRSTGTSGIGPAEMCLFDEAKGAISPLIPQRPYPCLPVSRNDSSLNRMSKKSLRI